MLTGCVPQADGSFYDSSFSDSDGGFLPNVKIDKSDVELYASIERERKLGANKNVSSDTQVLYDNNKPMAECTVDVANGAPNGRNRDAATDSGVEDIVGYDNRASTPEGTFDQGSGDGEYDIDDNRASTPEGMDHNRASTPEGMDHNRASTPEGMDHNRASTPEGMEDN